MLILPPGHAEAVSSSRRLTATERRIVRVVAAVAVLLVALSVFALTRGTPAPARGCISITFPSSLGGQPLSACGAPARTMCAQVGVRGGYVGELGQLIGEQCRKQAIKVG